MRRLSLVLVLFATTVFAADKTPTYDKGTVTKNFSADAKASTRKTYTLKGEAGSYEISNCADFQDGQSVDYRAKEDKVFIRKEDGKEYKCAIVGRIMAAEVKGPPTYQKGTIEGFETRRDYTSSSGGNNGTLTLGRNYRKAKVYQLRGPDLIYKVDYCGAFQAGKFTPGQVVDFRVEGDRLYIRHDEDKEYSCQIEGTKLPDKPAETAKPEGDATPPGKS